ncbi:hypothetical protein BDV3_001092 [Batrachochytrium dendrobatidis]|nr:hypothetical protein O5D80_005870 [Batrachochytrium dendrobatidis]KAK5671352.1 hypothetical protein QVD99_002071 [Batrachochytrium dendrobatidis]
MMDLGSGMERIHELTAKQNEACILGIPLGDTYGNIIGQEVMMAAPLNSFEPR